MAWQREECRCVGSKAQRGAHMLGRRRFAATTGIASARTWAGLERNKSRDEGGIGAGFGHALAGAHGPCKCANEWDEWGSTGGRGWVRVQEDVLHVPGSVLCGCTSAPAEV